MSLRHRAPPGLPPRWPLRWCEERVGSREGERGGINLLQWEAVVPAHRVWSWAPPGHSKPPSCACRTLSLQTPLASSTEPSAQGMLLPPSVTVIYCLLSAQSDPRGTRQLGNADPALNSSLLPLAHLGFLPMQYSNVITLAQFLSRVGAEEWLRKICRGKMMPQLYSHPANFFSQHTVLQLSCKALGDHLTETLILWCSVCNDVHGVRCYSPSSPSLSHGCSHFPPSSGLYRSISRVPQVLPGQG